MAVIVVRPGRYFLSMTSTDLLLCTGTRVLLPGEDDLVEASLLIDRQSGKIIDVQRGLKTPDQFGVNQTLVEWIQAGNNVVLPGLVE